MKRYKLILSRTYKGLFLDDDGEWINYTPEIEHALKNEARRKERIAYYEELMDECKYKASDWLHYQDVIIALEECKVK